MLTALYMPFVTGRVSAAEHVRLIMHKVFNFDLYFCDKLSSNIIDILRGYFTGNWTILCYSPNVHASTPNNAVNSSPPGQNGRLFEDDVSICTFVNAKWCISIQISLKFVPKGWDNCLASIRRQAIFCTNDGLVYWCICALLGVSEWINMKQECVYIRNIWHDINITNATKPFVNILKRRV